MQVRELGDPRLEELFGGGEPRNPDVRPVVRLPRTGLSGWALAAMALVAAIVLFWILESRRQAPAEPSVRPRAADAGQLAPEPPPLYIPPQPRNLAGAPSNGAAAETQPLVETAPRAIFAPTPVAPQFSYMPQPMPAEAPPAQAPARTASGPVLVIDTTAPGVPGAGGEAGAAAPSIGAGSPGNPAPAERMRVSALANRSTTVPKGTLIPAVLETAFDSTQPGFARAIVSRDVRGFDGTKILIPRGSRLVGEYGADVSAGQKRALITWTRLLRPDGKMIALNSPAVDPMGRGGIRADVNSHFLERFGTALLQTTLNLGGTLATRATTGSVIVALPGSTQGSASPAPAGTPAPTLRVRGGTSISVFVAHDLDFGSGDGG